jgi:hypothetical protein
MKTKTLLGMNGGRNATYFEDGFRKIFGQWKILVKWIYLCERYVRNIIENVVCRAILQNDNFKDSLQLIL